MYNDADIEQTANEYEGRQRDAHYDAGFCTHGSAIGYQAKPLTPEQEGLKPGEMRCASGCKTVYESTEAWMDASADPYSDPIARVQN